MFHIRCANLSFSWAVVAVKGGLRVAILGMLGETKGERVMEWDKLNLEVDVYHKSHENYKKCYPGH